MNGLSSIQRGATKRNLVLLLWIIEVSIAFEVARKDGCSAAVSVRYYTEDATAFESKDYKEVRGTLDFLKVRRESLKASFVGRLYLI